MPNMADIIVKKSDGTTNITYSAFQPAGGDGVFAEWRSNSVGAAAAQRPSYKMKAHANTQGNARIVNENFVYPILATNASTGQVSVVGYLTRKSETKVFLSTPDVDAKEAVAQAANLSASTLVQACLSSGVAPN